MPLGKEVGLGPGHIVLDDDPMGTQPPTAAPPYFRPMPIVAKQSPISATAELLLYLYPPWLWWTKLSKPMITGNPIRVEACDREGRLAGWQTVSRDIRVTRCQRQVTKRRATRVCRLNWNQWRRRETSAGTLVSHATPTLTSRCVTSRPVKVTRLPGGEWPPRRTWWVGVSWAWSRDNKCKLLVMRLARWDD